MEHGIEAGDLLRRTALLTRRTLPQAFGYAVAFRVMAVAVLFPMSAAIIRMLLASSGRRVVANADILAFLLSPLGLIAGLGIAAVTLMTLLAGYAGNFAIAYGAVHGRRVGWFRALRVVGATLPAALRLGVAIVWRTALLIAPFALALGAAYVLLLGEHDINWYLATRPAEFVLAAGIAVVLGLAFALLLATRLAAWGFGVPLVLFAGRAPRDAFGEVRRALRGRSIRTLLPVLLSAAAAILIGATAIVLTGILGELLLDLVGERLRAAALVLGLVVTVSFALAIVADALLATAVTQSIAVTHERLRHVFEPPLPAPDRDDGPLGVPSRRAGRGRVVLAALVLTVPAVAVGIGLVGGIRSPDDVLCIAHRAGAAHGPENSLAALRAAIAAGADLAEIDVQLTADGVIVVCHDRDLMRLAGQPWRIGDTTAEQLRSVSIGDGERIASLSEFLAEASGRIRLCIELKYYGFDERLAPKVVAVLREAGAMESSELMSLEWRAVRQLRDVAPEARVGFLSAVAVGDLSRLDVDFLALSVGIAKAPLVAAARERGLDVYAWTLNDGDRVSDAIDLGVVGIITDDPPLVRRVLEERAELSDTERLVLRFGALHAR